MREVPILGATSVLMLDGAHLHQPSQASPASSPASRRHPSAKTLWGERVALHLGSDLLLLGFGAYDLTTRGRLHPAYSENGVLRATGRYGARPCSC